MKQDLNKILNKMGRWALPGLLALFCSGWIDLTAQTVPKRTIPGLDAELFDIDVAHSYLGFSIGFMGLNKVRGRFTKYDGAILYNDEDPSKLSFTIVIDASSIDTGLGMRDKDLQGEQFFDVPSHPYIIFQSERIEQRPDSMIAHGNLMMRGVAKSVEVPFVQTVRRSEDMGWQNVRIGCEGRLTLNRNDFAVGTGFWAKALTEEVEIEFTILGRIFNLERFAGGSKENAAIIAQLLTTAAEKGGQAALTQFHELTAGRPFEANHIATIGRKLVQRGNLEAALLFFELATKIKPDHALGYQKLGETYALLGRRDLAIQYFRQLSELDASSATAMEMLKRLPAVKP